MSSLTLDRIQASIRPLKEVQAYYSNIFIRCSTCPLLKRRHARKKARRIRLGKFEGQKNFELLGYVLVTGLVDIICGLDKIQVFLLHIIVEWLYFLQSEQNSVFQNFIIHISFGHLKNVGHLFTIKAQNAQDYHLKYCLVLNNPSISTNDFFVLQIRLLLAILK